MSALLCPKGCGATFGDSSSVGDLARYAAHVRACKHKSRPAETAAQREGRMLADADRPETFTRYEKSLLNNGDPKGAAAAVRQRFKWARGRGKVG